MIISVKRCIAPCSTRGLRGIRCAAPPSVKNGKEPMIEVKPQQAHFIFHRRMHDSREQKL
jgi:hypothetical protein